MGSILYRWLFSSPTEFSHFYLFRWLDLAVRTVSGKLNRCEYEQLTPDEDNNNRPVDAKKNGKNKTQHHRRFGSIDDDNDRDSQDDSGIVRFNPALHHYLNEK